MLVYIHIPFCDSKCHYCAFNSYVDENNLKKEYIKALTYHLKYELQRVNKKAKTLFIGGGTPSCIEANLYEEIFKIIKPYLQDNAEITTEANPNSATKNWLQTMFDFGVNRVSFGVQSFDDGKLKLLGRAHNSDDAITAVKLAKNIGFKKINCDLIYGVNGDSLEKISKDIDILKSLEVDHISAYSLTIEKGTKFYKNQTVKIDDEKLSSEIFSYLENSGFFQYEISNFATKKSSRSVHNSGYWDYEEYLGIGAGAVGCMNFQRSYCKNKINKYIKNPLEIEYEQLSLQDVKVEKVLLGFRCFLGVDLKLFSKTELQKVEQLVRIKKVILKDNRVFATTYLLADELALYILD